MPAKLAAISVESLRPVKVLYEGDLYDLACLLLKLYEAKDRETNSQNPRSFVRCRPTVNGLAVYYSLLVSSVSRERVLEALEGHGLPLDATVEHGDAARKVAP